MSVAFDYKGNTLTLATSLCKVDRCNDLQFGFDERHGILQRYELFSETKAMVVVVQPNLGCRSFSSPPQPPGGGPRSRRCSPEQ